MSNMKSKDGLFGELQGLLREDSKLRREIKSAVNEGTNLIEKTKEKVVATKEKVEKTKEKAEKTMSDIYLDKFGKLRRKKNKKGKIKIKSVVYGYEYETDYIYDSAERIDYYYEALLVSRKDNEGNTKYGMICHCRIVPCIFDKIEITGSSWGRATKGRKKYEIDLHMGSITPEEL